MRHPFRVYAGVLLVLGIGYAVSHFNPSEAQESISIPPKRALVMLNVPANAIVKFGGAQMNQAGPSRMYFTPDLEPGTYDYSIEVAWSDAGKQYHVSRKIAVTPGRLSALTVTAADAKVSDPVPAKGETKPELPKVEKPKVETKPELPKVEKPKVETKPELPKVESKKASAVKSRAFEFTYEGKVKDLPPGKTAKVWIPVASTTPLQDVGIAKKIPASAQLGKDEQYGNSILYFEGKADAKGEIPFQVSYVVKRLEAQTNQKASESPKLLDRFLAPDAKVPIAGKPLELIKNKKVAPESFAAAKNLYDVVFDHMEYKKEGIGWGQGDTNWACDSGYGNCTDFHSIFISLARAKKIPAKFEMGFSIPVKRGADKIGGYHCWAWFMPEKSWVPVDISDAKRTPSMKEYYFGNLTEDRIHFTTGRDIDLVPKQAGKALNFFIYPYVEVDGQVYEKVDRAFSYQDIQ